jgi:hypothetical protein
MTRVMESNEERIFIDGPIGFGLEKKKIRFVSGHSALAVPFCPNPDHALQRL